jgi:hypothetical protein
MSQCEKCRTRRRLTRHHVLPRRFFGSPDDAPICVLCRPCHDELERLIPLKVEMPIPFYWTTLFRFLGSDRVRIVQWCGRRSYHARLRQVQEAAGDEVHAVP